MINVRRKFLLITIGVSLLAVFSAGAHGQPMPPDQGPAPLPPRVTKPVILHPPGDSTERAIAVDKNVNMSLCVTQGNVTINGWGRGEIRVVVRDGSKFGFKTQYKDPTTGLPALVMLFATEMKGKYSTDCLWGEEIEIDVPMNATINVKGKEIHTTIDGVRKTSVNIIGGDIVLRHIAEGVKASTGQGDITVEGSTGPMNLETTTGNVIVFDSGPREIGDNFRAKTNSGNLSLQQLIYRQVEVTSISGSVMFTGNIVDGAAYSMGTTNGSIRLQVPQATDFQLVSIFSAGNFSTEIPYKILTENISEGSVKNIHAKFGKGGAAMVKLTTSNGSIGIRKL